MSDPTTEHFTLEQVAEELSVSLSTVQEWVRTKALGSFKHGRNRRVSRAALMQFIAEHSVRPRTAEWMTPAAESKLRQWLDDLVAAKVEALHQREQRKAA